MKNLLAVGLPLAMLGLLVLSMWYVGSRLGTLFGLTSRWQIQVGIVVVVIASMVAVFATAKSSIAVLGVLNVVGGYIVIFYLFLLLALLGLHLVQLVWNPPMLGSGIGVLALAFVVTAVGAVLGHSFVVKETVISLPRLGKEITVMQISDVHIGHHRGRAYLEQIVAETNRRKPDLVIITGDLIDAGVALEPGVLEPLSGFAAPAYFVGGNHENYVDADRVFGLLAQYGVRVLRAEIVETHGLQLVGLDYMKADEDTFDMHPSNDPRTIKSVLASLPLNKDIPSLLLHHSPVGVEYAAAAGIDLMLSGHTHGGQVFPATLIAALAFPFNRGLHKTDKTAVFVTPGAGTFMARVRLGTSNEISLLRLTPGE